MLLKIASRWHLSCRKEGSKTFWIYRGASSSRKRHCVGFRSGLLNDKNICIKLQISDPQFPLWNVKVIYNNAAVVYRFEIVTLKTWSKLLTWHAQVNCSLPPCMTMGHLLEWLYVQNSLWSGEKSILLSDAACMGESSVWKHPM